MAGKCFKCKEPGHMARDCPQGKTVTNKGNKPPGVAAYNIGIQDIEKLRELAKTMATIEEIHIGNINVQIVEEHVT
jgi:hypothetical protein